MDTVEPPERLHLGRAERTVEINPSLPGPQVSLQSAPGDPEVSTQQSGGTTGIGQFIGCHTHVIEFLTYCEWHSVAIVQRTPAGGEDCTLSPLAQGLIGPSVTLDQLELCCASQDGQNPQRETELYCGYARLRLGHSVSLVVGGSWHGKEHEFGIDRLMETQQALRDRHQHLAARGHPYPALELGATGFQVAALLPEIVKVASGAESHRLSGHYNKGPAQKDQEPQQDPVSAFNPHRSPRSFAAWRSLLSDLP
jgi:hypothetical protein